MEQFKKEKNFGQEFLRNNLSSKCSPFFNRLWDYKE